MKHLNQTQYTLFVDALICTTFLIGWGIADSIAQEPASEVVLTSDVQWGPLNPARGDKGPRAGTLWGDRTGSGPSGFLVEFVDGFSSPPHIHNITYRGVVISGRIHTDDPDAEKMWLPAGSFWTQTAGKTHITAAAGSHNLAYLEIGGGPYLVLSTEEAFDNGEKPVNVDASNIVWLDASAITWIHQSGRPASANKPKLAFLWGSPLDGQLNGSLVKLPAGFSGTARSHGSTLRAVVTQGRLNHQLPDESGVKSVEPGSYFDAEGASVHQVSCPAEEACILYVRTQGKFDIIPA